MSRFSWILLALLASLLILGLLGGQLGLPQKEWQKCKESLFVHYLTGACTLRDGYVDTDSQ